MADDEAELQIRIQSIFNAQGTDAAVKGLDQVTESTNEASKAAGKSSEAVKETGHSFIHAESSGRAFHKLMHSIAHTSPLMGEALRLALDPLSGLLIGASLAIAYLHKREEDLKKAAEETAKSLGEEFATITESAANLHTEAVESSVAFLKSMSDLEKAQNSAEAGTARVVTAIKQQGEALRALADIQEKYDLSQAKDDDEKESIKNKYEAIKAEHTEQEELRELIAKTEEYTEAKSKEAKLAAETAAATNAGSEQKQKTQEDLDETNKRIGFAKQRLSEPLPKAVREDDERYLATLVAKKQADEATMKDADARIKAAQEAEYANKKIITDGGAALPGLEASYQQHAAARSLKEGGSDAAMLASGADALKALKEHGGKLQELSKGQADAIRALTAFLSSHGVNNTVMVNLIERSAGDVVKLNIRLQAIESRVKSSVNQ